MSAVKDALVSEVEEIMAAQGIPATGDNLDAFLAVQACLMGEGRVWVDGRSHGRGWCYYQIDQIDNAWGLATLWQVTYVFDQGQDRRVLRGAVCHTRERAEAWVAWDAANVEARLRRDRERRLAGEVVPAWD
jgi:hypothetical protein